LIINPVVLVDFNRLVV